YRHTISCTAHRQAGSGFPVECALAPCLLKRLMATNEQLNGTCLVSAHDTNSNEDSHMNRHMDRRHTLACLALAGLVVGLALQARSQRTIEAADPASKVVRIGMVNTLLRDVPDSLVETMAKPFGMLMSSQTGMTGVLAKTGDANDLGRKLTTDEVQI